MVTSGTECSACKSLACHSTSSTQTMDELIILLEQKAFCIFSHHTWLGSIVISVCKCTLMEEGQMTCPRTQTGAGLSNLEYIRNSTG